MNTFYLLVILTQNGAGDINASFVNTTTLLQCQQKALMVEGVFLAAEIPVLESRCLESGLQFSEFGHASAASEIRNFYLISTGEESMKISAVVDWQTCMRSQKKTATAAHVYCASSVQSIRGIAE